MWTAGAFLLAEQAKAAGGDRSGAAAAWAAVSSVFDAGLVTGSIDAFAAVSARAVLAISCAAEAAAATLARVGVLLGGVCSDTQ